MPAPDAEPDFEVVDEEPAAPPAKKPAAKAKAAAAVDETKTKTKDPRRRSRPRPPWMTTRKKTKGPEGSRRRNSPRKTTKTMTARDDDEDRKPKKKKRDGEDDRDDRDEMPRKKKRSGSERKAASQWLATSSARLVLVDFGYRRRRDLLHAVECQQRNRSRKRKNPSEERGKRFLKTQWERSNTESQSGAESEAAGEPAEGAKSEPQSRQLGRRSDSSTPWLPRRMENGAPLRGTDAADPRTCVVTILATRLKTDRGPGTPRNWVAAQHWCQSR